MKYIINNSNSINKILSKCNSGDILFLKNGIYKEKVEIYSNGITIIGESKENVIITNNDYYHKIMPDNNECNTFRTYTLYVNSDNVKIENLTIENSSVPSSKYGQAVALHVDGDNFYGDNLIIKSAQDTLFTGPMPQNLIDRYQGFQPDSHLLGKETKQIYNNCLIIGDVDFIFGGSTALFYQCQIHSLLKNTSPFETNGYCCAPSHSLETRFGYLFYKCNFTCDKGTKNVFLARPWRDYGYATFIDSDYAEHIVPEGFNKWNNTNRDKTARFYEYSTKYDLSKRVPWAHILTENEKEIYIYEYFKYINFKE